MPAVEGEKPTLGKRKREIAASAVQCQSKKLSTTCFLEVKKEKAVQICATLCLALAG